MTSSNVSYTPNKAAAIASSLLILSFLSFFQGLLTQSLTLDIYYVCLSKKVTRPSFPQESFYYHIVPRNPYCAYYVLAKRKCKRHSVGSSHQNVKQVALKLEQKGLLVFEKDKKDARMIRLNLTDQINEFAQLTQSKATAFTQALFKGIEKDDMSKARAVLQKMLSNLTEMDQPERDE